MGRISALLFKDCGFNLLKLMQKYEQRSPYEKAENLHKVNAEISMFKAEDFPIHLCGQL